MILFSEIIRPFFLTYYLSPSKLTPADLTDDVNTRKVVGKKILSEYFSNKPLGPQSDKIVQVIFSYIKYLIHWQFTLGRWNSVTIKLLLYLKRKTHFLRYFWLKKYKVLIFSNMSSKGIQRFNIHKMLNKKQNEILGSSVFPECTEL